MRILHEVQRIEHIVDDVAEQVAHGGRPDQGNEKIGPRFDAIAAQGVAERTEMVRQAGGPGDINHPGDADSRVGDKTHRRRAGPGRSKLQHIVYEHHRLAEIDEDVVDGLADRPRSQGVIEEADDSQPPPGQGLLDGEAATVEAFERIIHGRSGVRSADPAQHREGKARAGERAAGCRRSPNWFGIKAAYHGFGTWRRHGLLLAQDTQTDGLVRRLPSACRHIPPANDDSIESGESERAFTLLQAWLACGRHV